ncbi:MAG: SPASM domain-containing protein [Candidatus Omnitrophica bacterium]|nr:SPASM domain-containing protein [Candidatus Omnitrophota bacterium]
MNVKSPNKDNQKVIYEKSQSFSMFISQLENDQEKCRLRCCSVLEQAIPQEVSSYKKEILQLVLNDLKDTSTENKSFKLTTFITDELSRISDEHLPRYFFHRYRYDIFPKQKKLDQYPPYLQIEPASVCNYRCVFCYQTDASFADKKNGFMGTMSFDLFKEIIDQSEGNIEFFSLASRGEPFVCKDIDQMLEYCRGKFLGFKINTNASLLNERHCHAILSGGVNTMVISADAAVEPLYSQMRVGGKLERVIKNLELFYQIKNKQYPKSKLITRVSGVKFNEKQSMDSMKEVWGPLVDQVCFVDYNPWENVYDSPVSQVDEPCSDLWRRMFVWYDGKVNPCDTDYKSTLAVGSVEGTRLSELWRNAEYEQLRFKHLNNLRKEQEPCRRCTVI